MKYFGIIDKNIAANFNCNKRLEIFLTHFCNILCYVGIYPLVHRDLRASGKRSSRRVPPLQCNFMLQRHPPGELGGAPYSYDPPTGYDQELLRVARKLRKPCVLYTKLPSSSESTISFRVFPISLSFLVVAKLFDGVRARRKKDSKTVRKRQYGVQLYSIL